MSEQVPADVTAAWPGLGRFEPVAAGDRSSVWASMLDGRRVAVRRSKRSGASLDWELDLLQRLHEEGFVVPVPVTTSSGTRAVDGWSVTSWLEGAPPSSPADWRLVADELVRLHRVLRAHPQRPDACTITELDAVRRSVDADLDRVPDEVEARCLAHFDPYLECQRSLIHGDPNPDNIRITDGRVGLLDWDESRVDVPDLDLANLGVTVLAGDRLRCALAAADAWETVNAWTAEPAYARRRFEAVPQPRRIELPSLTDGTIVLRPRTVADAVAQVAGEDDEIIRWLTGGVATIERTRQHIGNVHRAGRAAGLRRNFGIYLVGSGELIGNLDINLADIELELNEANLSYAVFPAWRGRGVAARALALGLDYLGSLADAPAPALKIDPANRASVAVARRSGFAVDRAITPPLNVYRR